MFPKIVYRVTIIVIGDNRKTWSYPGVISSNTSSVFSMSKEDAGSRIAGSGVAGDPNDPRTGRESAGSAEKALKKVPRKRTRSAREQDGRAAESPPPPPPVHGGHGEKR